MASAALSDFEPVMGLEVHCQLKTASKAFCSCPTRFGDAPNTNTCPTCLGLPGALPVFNERALELAVLMGLATGCTIRERSVFARKNYFYADLPKGYQISQYDQPLAERGQVVIEVPGGSSKVVGLTRIHLEEDAGKSLHEASATTTFVDFNRSGVPLVEIVSEPDFRSTDEVHAYLVAIRRLVRYLGVSDGNMEQGSLRCDVNVSVRQRGAAALGTKVELKNLNSFRSVVHAIDHEVERQAAILREGGTVLHGTRLWDEAEQVTRPMRRKEMAHDYRYFPDPDLLVLEASQAFVERMRGSLPELPAAKRRRFESELGLPAYDAEVLTSSRALAAYFEDVLALSPDAKQASNWVLGEVLRDLKERNQDLEGEPRFPMPPERLADLLRLVADGTLSLQAAKRVFETVASTERSVEEVADELGLRQVSDESAVGDAVREVLEQHAAAVADYRAGNPKTFGFLVGQVMRVTKGQANPQVANRILRRLLDER